LNQQQHVMLLSRGDEQEASTQYINEALKKGYLIIYLQLMGQIITAVPPLSPK
jgi:hypothetical protein